MTHRRIISFFPLRSQHAFFCHAFVFLVFSNTSQNEKKKCRLDEGEAVAGEEMELPRIEDEAALVVVVEVHLDLSLLALLNASPAG